MPSQTFSLPCVAGNQSQHSIDGLDGAIQEFNGLRIAYTPPASFGRHPAAAEQPLAERLSPIGANIVDRSDLMQCAPGCEGSPILRAVNGRDRRRECTYEYNSLIGVDHHAFGFTLANCQQSSALHPG